SVADKHPDMIDAEPRQRESLFWGLNLKDLHQHGHLAAAVSSITTSPICWNALRTFRYSRRFIAAPASPRRALRHSPHLEQSRRGSDRARPSLSPLLTTAVSTETLGLPASTPSPSAPAALRNSTLAPIANTPNVLSRLSRVTASASSRSRTP